MDPSTATTPCRSAVRRSAKFQGRTKEWFTRDQKSIWKQKSPIRTVITDTASPRTPLDQSLWFLNTISRKWPAMSADPETEETKSRQLREVGLLSSRPGLGARPVSCDGASCWLWLVCSLLVVMIFAAGGVIAWHLRQNALDSSQREMTKLGVVLAEQTSRCVQSVDLIL